MNCNEYEDFRELTPHRDIIMKDYKAFFKSKITEEVGWVIVSAKDEFEAERIVESMLNKSYELMFVEEKRKVQK